MPSATAATSSDLIAPDGTRHALEHEPRLVTADLMMIREAVLRGVGIAALPEMMYGARAAHRPIVAGDAGLDLSDAAAVRGIRVAAGHGAGRCARSSIIWSRCSIRTTVSAFLGECPARETTPLREAVFAIAS